MVCADYRADDARAGESLPSKAPADGLMQAIARCRPVGHS